MELEGLKDPIWDLMLLDVIRTSQVDPQLNRRLTTVLQWACERMVSPGDGPVTCDTVEGWSLVAPSVSARPKLNSS